MNILNFNSLLKNSPTEFFNYISECDLHTSNLQDQDGNTILHIALEHTLAESIIFDILHKGVNPFILNHAGKHCIEQLNCLEFFIDLQENSYSPKIFTETNQLFHIQLKQFFLNDFIKCYASFDHALEMKNFLQQNELYTIHNYIQLFLASDFVSVKDTLQYFNDFNISPKDNSFMLNCSLQYFSRKMMSTNMLEEKDTLLHFVSESIFDINADLLECLTFKHTLKLYNNKNTHYQHIINTIIFDIINSGDNLDIKHQVDGKSISFMDIVNNNPSFNTFSLYLNYQKTIAHNNKKETHKNKI